MISIIATSSNLIGSRLIKWAIGESASHIVIGIDYLAIHSNHKGVHFRWKDNLIDELKISSLVNLDMTLEDEEKVFQAIGKLDGKKYDFKAFWYFALRAIMKKMFNIPIPTKSFWQDNDKYLCVEVAKSLPSKYIEGLDLAIVTPNQLVEHIISKVGR